MRRKRQTTKCLSTEWPTTYSHLTNTQTTVDVNNIATLWQLSSARRKWQSTTCPSTDNHLTHFSSIIDYELWLRFIYTGKFNGKTSAIKPHNCVPYLPWLPWVTWHKVACCTVAKVRGLDIPMVHAHFCCEKFLVLYFDKGSFTLANLYGDSIRDYDQQLCLLLALDTMTQGEEATYVQWPR
jgi:hypothetical protein